MNRKMISVRAAEIVIVLGCLAGCFFITGCFGKPYGNHPDVFVSGGGFLMSGSENGTLALTNLGMNVDTQSLLFNYRVDDGGGILGGLSGSSSSTVLQQLWIPTTTGGVLEYDVSGGVLAAPKTVSTGSRIVLSLAADSQTVYAAHPFDGSVSEINASTRTVSSVITLASGRQPSLIANGNGLYVISKSDLVKLSGGNNPAEYGSAKVGDSTTGLAAGSGYVVVTDIGNDNIYVFIDDGWSTGPPVLHGIIATPNGSPVQVAISPGGPTAYVTVFKGTDGRAPGAVDVIDLKNLVVTAQIAVGACPSPVAITQVADTTVDPLQLLFNGGDYAYKDSSVLVGNQCDSTLSRIDVGTLKVVQTLTLPGAPNAIATR